jgi:ATP-binding cassette, subfamily B, bacterial
MTGSAQPQARLTPGEALAVTRLVLAASVRADAWLTVAVFAITLVESVTLIAIAWLVKQLVQGVQAGDARTVLTALILLGTCVSASMLSGWYNVTFQKTLDERTDHWLEQQLIRLVDQIPGVAHVGEPRFQDNLHTLLSSRTALTGTISTLTSATGVLVRLVGTELLLIRLSPLLAVLPAFAAGPVLAGIRTERILTGAVTAAQQRSRLARQLFQITTTPACGQELRIFAAGRQLMARHGESLDAIEVIHRTARRRTVTLTAVAWLAFAVGFTAVVLAALSQLGPRTTPGSILLLFILIAQIASQSRLVSDVVGTVSRQTDTFRRYLWVEERAKAMARPGLEGSPVPDQIRHGIELREVTFRYPGAAEPALRDVSLFLPAGSVVALVGSNGAGKTSLISLLLALWQPMQGSILVDGQRLDAIRPRDWQAASTAGFQDFCRFELRAMQAVGVGDLPHRSDEIAVNRALDRARVVGIFSELPQGLRTRLGRSAADGIDLSGGQWQKLALGRAMMPRTPLLFVLDEPTSSLDPEVEYELFRGYRHTAREFAASSGCVTVFVSHRFASARTADLVVVIEDGRVVEVGTHDELTAADGRYACLFNAQAQGYR